MKLLAKTDKLFLISTLVLVSFGFFIFLSAAMGLATRDGASFAKVVLNQAIIGIIGGGIVFFIAASIKYEYWKKWSFYIFILALLLTACVFIPWLGWSHGGAKRWIEIGGFTFQPAEILKLAYVLYLGAWLSKVKDKVSTWTYGFLPFCVITAIPAALLLAQPDTDTTAVMITAGLAMYFVAGAKWKHIFTLILFSAIVLAALVFTRPYLMDRVKTYINPLSDKLGSSYQVQQSLIALGSGGVIGNGFGQSLQKFKYLPEPIGDSIFSVAGEEFGFVGTTILIALYIIFVTRGFHVGAHSRESFGRLVAVGIVILIIGQVFLNIASMVGLVPISGLTLSFISHGSTSLMVALGEAGIILNISRYKIT